MLELMWKLAAALTMFFALGTGIVYGQNMFAVALFWAFLTGGFLVVTMWAVTLDIAEARMLATARRPSRNCVDKK